MKLLAIDPSTTEVGVYDGFSAETWKLGGKKAKLSERLGDLMVRVAEKLTEEPDNPFDFVACEENFMRNKATTEALNKALGVIEAMAWNSGAGFMMVPNGTVRAWATGTGRKQVSDKDDADNPMFAKARLLVPRKMWHTLDQHTADAICIYNYVIEKGWVD